MIFKSQRIGNHSHIMIMWMQYKKAAFWKYNLWISLSVLLWLLFSVSLNCTAVCATYLEMNDCPEVTIVTDGAHKRDRSSEEMYLPSVVEWERWSFWQTTRASSCFPLLEMWLQSDSWLAATQSELTDKRKTFWRLLMGLFTCYFVFYEHRDHHILHLFNMLQIP